MPVSECVPNLCVVGRCVFPAVLRRGPSCTFVLGSSPWGRVVFSAGAPRSRGCKGEITELGNAGGLKQVSKMLVGERGGTSGDRKRWRQRQWWFCCGCPRSGKTQRKTGTRTCIWGKGAREPCWKMRGSRGQAVEGVASRRGRRMVDG